ncbi:MAG: ArnT family glycosyltransferase [Candidatus Woesearchaeota archaeon]
MKHEHVLVGSIFLYATLLRLWGLGALSVWLDEAISAYAASQILVYGIPLLESGWLYLGGLPYTYVLSLFMLFSESAWWLRMPSVLFGIALVVFCWYVCKKVWNLRVAVAVALFVATNYWLVAWSRQIRHYMLAVLLIVFLLYFTYVYVTEKRGVYWLAGSITLASLTHAAGAFVACAVAVVLVLDAYKKQMFSYSLLGVLALIGLFVFRAARTITLEMNYFSLYLSWLWNEIPVLLVVSLLAVFLGRKERFLLALVVVYVLVASFFMPLFHYRYLLWVFVILATLCFVVLEKWSGKLYWPLVVVVVLFSGFMLPTTEVYLEPATPQPPWSEVYSSIPSGVISDAHPVIARFYGVTVDGWYSNSLTGRAVTRENDAYLGVSVLEEADVIIVDDRVLAQRTITGNKTVFGTRYWSRAYIIQ